MSQGVMDWLDEVRGIDPELASALGLESAQGKTGEVLVIPYHRGGEALGRKFRAIGDKRFACDKGMSKDLWNVDCLHDVTLADTPVVITEGELDAVACIQAGHVRSVSIPDGWTEGLEGESGDGAKVEPILRNEAALRKSPFVIVAGDNDAVGLSFVRAVANLLEGHPVKFAEWPQGCKDPNDVLKMHGEAALTKAINEARFVDPPGGMITAVSNMPPVADAKIWRTDLPAIDRVAAFERGGLGIGTGYPGQGKSTLLRFIAWQLVRNNDIRVGLLELETPGRKVRDHLFRLETGLPFDGCSGHQKDETFAKLDRNWRIMHRLNGDEFTHDMGWLKKMIHTVAVREQCSFILIDPWNEIDHLLDQGESRTDYINMALSKLRNWAQRYQVHVFVNAHPTKAADESKPPLGYQIADSAAWFNKPDLGLTVFQKPESDESQLINWKARDREVYGINTRAMSRLNFDPQKMVFRGVI